MIVYGVAAETSIGALFLAGVIPGLLMAGALMLMVRHLAIRRNLPRHPFEGAARAVDRVPPRVLGADGAGRAVRRAVLRRVHADRSRGGRRRLRAGARACSSIASSGSPTCRSIILDTVETTGVVMALVMTASLLGYCISVSRLPQEFGATLTALTTNPLVYLLIVNVLLLVVGCFMEALAAMLVLIPILVPPALALGIDPVQFGLVFVLNLMIGTITPPVGVVLYVTAKVADVPFERMARAVVPYLVPLLAVLALITRVARR